MKNHPIKIFVPNHNAPLRKMRLLPIRVFPMFAATIMLRRINVTRFVQF